VAILPRADLITPFLAAGITTILLAPLMLTWNHVVISEPSPKFWFRRIPNLRTIMKVLPATALFAAALQLARFLPTALIHIFRMHRVGEELARADDTIVAQEIVGVFFAQLLVFLAVTIFVYVMILIPADVTLTRVQASLLPESDETIVPMDRSFGGKFVSERVGGSGKLGLLDAWRSFGWVARARLVKLYAKVFIIQVAIIAIFVTIFAFEVGIAFPPLMCKTRIVANAFLRGDIRL
jgi:hypothetical protein